METWVERHEVFSGPIFTVYTGQARLDDGQTARRDMVAHRGGVGIVALHEERVLLVRQFRLAGGAAFEEIPAGLRELGEDAAAANFPEGREKVHPRKIAGGRT